ncbi:hypothetical protein SporoP37_12105 [Sporosarcina sp. P37]|nr:hypothetical protein SporoP37_12105 [Sporosarcina sp. P37]PID15773.1 hypothetical protein CSV62_16020 [Sporosarcina sp. P35]
MKSPIEEMERKKHYFTDWLRERNIEIPLMDYIVFAYQNELAIEKTSSHRLAFSYEIPNRLRSLEMKETLLTADQIKRLANEITRSHREYDPLPLIEKYSLAVQDIAAGVTCTHCQQLTMQWRSKSWRCRACGHHDKAAHINALSEWYCISGPQLTNQNFRQFTDIGSRHAAKRMLANPFTELCGKKRNAVYHLSPKLLQPHGLSF